MVFFGIDFGRPRTWQLFGALWVSGWAVWIATSLVFPLGGGATASVVAIVVGAVAQAMALRYVLPGIVGAKLSFETAYFVAFVGQLPRIVVLAAGALGHSTALGTFSPFLFIIPTVATLLQFHILDAALEEHEEFQDEHSEPLAKAFARIDEPLNYASVLSGIRETVSAVERAFIATTAPREAILDELAALAAHARRLAELGPPDPAARPEHEELLAALSALQQELLVAQVEARADVHAAARVRTLTTSLSRYTA